MTKRQNKIYYICIVLCSILEITAAIGAYAAHYYTKTRMGMLRHVVYLNGKWEKLVNVPVLKWIVLVIVITLIILVYILYRKQKKHSITVKLVTIITLAIGFWTVYYLLHYNTGMNRAYYILSICFIIITMFQHILYYCIYLIKKPNQLNKRD